MATVKWRRGLLLPMDANSIRDYQLDFTAWLNGEVIVSSTVTPTGCTASVLVATGTSVKIRASQATANSSAMVRITTNSGQVEDFSIGFNLVAR